MNPKAPSLIAAFAAFSILPAASQVVFSESFESPVVSGYVSNTVPGNGKWIGTDTQAFGAKNRGLHNESVAWPATPPFTTPYGEQGYQVSYSNAALTTASGVFATITNGVTYTVTFHNALPAGSTGGNYTIQLVAFNGGDARNVNNTGTILASASGNVASSDMSNSGIIVHTAGATHAGKDLAVRLIGSTGHSVVYDNIRLIVGHDLNPSPASGEDLSAGGNVNLSWTNMPPNAGSTYVDVLFGTSPESLAIIPGYDGVLTSTAVVNAPAAGTYYWRVDSYPDGDPNGTPVIGDVFWFTISDTDGDGLPDSWEIANETNPNVVDDTADPDVDGLTNLQEFQYGTKANDNDTDDDTLHDGPEIAGAGLRPPTSPVDSDSDDDGLSDSVETNTGTWASSADTGTNPKDNDWDKDGLLDGVETNNDNLVDKTSTGTDPYISDTDADGAGDYYEVYASFTDPFDDTDKPFVPYPLPDPDGSTGAANKPVKVFICSGQSNMVGLGNVYGTGAGTLETITKRQNKFPNLLDASNNWTQRQDVRYRGVISAIANGPLTAGQGASDSPGTKIGPELGFGHIMGWYLDEPVLVLKSSIGNRSLGWDILPPGSPSYQYGTNNYAGYGDGDQKWAIGETPVPWSPGGWYAGYEWDRYFLHESQWAHPHAGEPEVVNVVDILDNWTAEYGGDGKPFAGRDFEIAGFVWWQGDKDRGDMGHADRYEQNLVNLIQSLRSYFANRYPNKGAIGAPFVLATLGQTDKDDTTPASDVAIFDAQMAVDGNAGKYAQFENNVKTVYAHPLSQGGASNNHYNENAETYMLVGDALGRAMIDLLEASAGPDENPPVVTGLNPSNGASDISAGANLVATFNELIAKGTGNITLRNLPDDGPTGDVVIAVTDASQVTVSSNTLTINPTANLATSTQYAVLIDATAIDDLVGNSYAGIADNVTWSFTTAAPDVTAPTLASTNPTNGASGVLVDSNLVATFSEPIAIGTGNITLHPTDNSGDIVIGITDGSQISVSGAVLTINPTGDLVGGKTYAVRIDATAIDDLVGNSYAGISDDVTWSFSTLAPPPAGVVFSDNFESPDASTSYTIANTSGLVDTTKWVRTNTGAFGATRNGIVGDDRVGENFTDPSPTGSQAYALRYSSNTGLTSAFGQIGTLAVGQTITLTFDVTQQQWSGGTIYKNYLAQLVLFDGASTRNVVTGGAGGADNTFAVLARATGNATGTGYDTISLSYTVGNTVIDNNGAAAGVSTTYLDTFVGKDIAIRFGGNGYSALIDNVQVSITGPGGPGPVDHFVISPIASPQTVGTPITGITITAKDASNNTATGFTGTVTFGGTGGFTGTSAAFTAGILTGVSVTPTMAGANLTFTVDDGASHTGNTTIATIQSQYDAWSGGTAFSADANGDGIKNGLAWLLGATNPNAAVALPAASRNGNDLVLTFSMPNAASRGAATLSVQHSGDAGITDAWTSAAVPESSQSVNGVSFTVTPNGNLNNVTATIPSTEAASGKLFGRLKGTP